MARTQRVKVSDVADALRASAGIHTAAARILAPKYGGFTTNGVKYYVERYPELQALKAELLEQTLDLAESKLITALNQGDMKSVFFFLRTRGKQRGYVERMEQTGKNGDPIETVTKLDLSDLTPEERDALRPILARRAGETERSSE